MGRISSLLTLSLVAMLAISCTKGADKAGSAINFTIKPTTGEPLAQVGKTILTVEELSEDFLARQGTFRGAPHLNTERKRNEFVENAVIQRTMFLEGIELGLMNDPQVKRDLEKIIVQKLMRDKLTQAQESYVPTEVEMKEHYDKNPNLYNRPEAVKVAFFAIPFGENKEGAKKLAMDLQKDAKATVQNANTKEFARLAMKHAQLAMNKIKVALETNESSFLEKSDFDAKYGKDSFDMVNKMEKIGDVGPVLTTDANFYVVMKTGYRKALSETYEEAKPKIQKRIAYEQRGKVYEKFVAELRQKYQVKIYQERVAELGKNATPPAATAGTDPKMPPATPPAGVNNGAIPAAPPAAAVPAATPAGAAIESKGNVAANH
jgi:hypothetical protein